MICFGKSDGALVEVSLADITQRPERFHGRHVRVAGFITLRHEGTSIYPSDGARTAEGLWLAVETLPGGCRALLSKFASDANRAC